MPTRPRTYALLGPWMHSLLLLVVTVTAAGSAAPWQKLSDTVLFAQADADDDSGAWSVDGETEPMTNEDGTAGIAVKSRVAAVAVGASDWERYTAEFRLKPAVSPLPFKLEIYPAVDTNPRHPRECELRVLRHDRKGASLTLHTYAYDQDANLYRFRNSATYTVWPTDMKALKLLDDMGVAPRTWIGDWLHFRIDAGRRNVRVWMNGRLVLDHPQPVRSNGGFRLCLTKGDELAGLIVRQGAFLDSRWVPLELGTYFNNASSADLGDGWAVGPDQLPVEPRNVEIRDIPFRLTGTVTGRDNLALRTAEWPEWRTDPGSYYEYYDRAPLYQGDAKSPILRIPRTDYTAAWLLAFADTTPESSTTCSLRVGRFSGLGIYHDFEGAVPRWNEDGDDASITALPVTLSHQHDGESQGRLFLVRLPIGRAVAQDFREYGEFLEMEITKKLRLAVRQPDPARFRIRPLGRASAIHIFALTLERAPVQLEVSSAEIGHIFNEPRKPEFQVRLTNVTGTHRRVTVNLAARSPGGDTVEESFSLRIPPHGAETRTARFRSLGRGYYELDVELAENRKVMLTRGTTFALLPADTRDRTVPAPWGTWNFDGAHNTRRIEQVGPLMRKLGMRYTLGSTDSQLARYGLRNFASRKIHRDGDVDGLRDYLEKYPGAVRRALIFHEDAVSGAHVMRPVDCTLDRSPYVMDASEEERFQKLWEGALTNARKVREEFPDIKIQLGNGNPHIVEKFLRRKFPAELFDSVGNENCAFMRPTEAPADIVSFNTLWWFRKIMDHYGYADKPLEICYEWMARSTAPGNLSETVQAQYYVRDALCGRAWGLEFINPGIICDVGNSYYYSNWGAGGFTHKAPELNPKPAYVAFATLTQLLDKAEFVKTWDCGSLTTFCLEFVSPERGSIYAMWTIRGQRKGAMEFHDRQAEVTIVDSMARHRRLDRPFRRTTTVTLGPDPVYVCAATRLKSLKLAATVYPAAPEDAACISKLDDLDAWQVEEDRSAELETYNFEIVRRPGRFLFTVEDAFEGRANPVRVTPQFPLPGTAHQPMYRVLAHRTGVAIPGVPKEVGLMVNGNSGWGRIIFELQDASGQRWISIGCPMKSTPTRWMADWLPQEQLNRLADMKIADWNTNDSEGRSAINFDGWRYLSFPLPGQYPGPEQFHWPRNCYWKYDKDGKVHYPLTFTKLIVELREKVVYIREFKPVPRPEVYLSNLQATY